MEYHDTMYKINLVSSIIITCFRKNYFNEFIIELFKGVLKDSYVNKLWI